MKLNIGCGPNGQIDGFVNIDNSKAIFFAKVPFIKKLLLKLKVISFEQSNHDWSNVLFMNAGRKLKFSDKVFSKIYTSHFLEHLPKDDGENAVREMYRVLKNGGVLRIVLPDLLWYAKKYVKETQSLIGDGEISHSRTVHDDFLEVVYGAFLNKKRVGLLHSYMFDLPSICCLLEQHGFCDIANFSFQEGRDNELKLYDSRPKDSIHIECRKPLL